MRAKILFLVEIHFSRWHWRRLGINTLKARGFDVAVLDFTKWIAPDYYETHKSRILDCPERVEINGAYEFERILRVSNAPLVIAFDNLGFNAITSQIRQKVYGEMKALRATWNLGLLPLPDIRNPLDFIRDLKSKTRLPIQALNRLRRSFTTQRMGPPDMAMLSGELSEAGPFARARHKIWCHAFDYDDFLEIRNIRVGSENIAPYAVYLDDNVVSGHDLQHCGLKSIATADRFYPRINRFFSAIESTFGLPVVIAAHPKSNYAAGPNVFGGRRIEMGRSAELVQSSALVLGHASASLNFPMFWRKPVLIMTSDDIESSHLGRYVRARAAQTRTNPFNIDRQSWDLSKVNICSVDNDCYSDYIRKYVKTSGSPNKPVWEIFSDYVERNLAGL